MARGAQEAGHRAASSSRSAAAPRPATSARTALLDLIVEGLPSPAARAQRARGRRRDARLAYVFKTIADPFSGKINLLRVFAGTLTADSTLVNSRTHAQGADRPAADAAGQGARAGRRARPGRHRRRRQAQGRRGTGDVLADVDEPAPIEPPRRSRRRSCRSRSSRRRKGDEEKVRRVAAAPGRGGSDAATSTATSRPASMIVAGPLADARRGRARADARGGSASRSTLHPPRVPYLETIRKAGARAGPLQEADRRPRPVRRLPHRARAAARRTRATSSSTRSSAA